jgi:hypothetical protein
MVIVEIFWLGSSNGTKSLYIKSYNHVKLIVTSRIHIFEYKKCLKIMHLELINISNKSKKQAPLGVCSLVV